ncbi:FG-GAP repeat domain-containing protein [Shewanella halotolerans]|uniref:FG-GAP repeat domain-containing protein n=1 Tax=Shewanella halotolerans TaxID=2864204 RepID=UPI001C65A053|nr:VCBS repeat-containing protein [Shewanella halotolerans]QYJ89500.1 VCBS repeat-containing protein [Shewanella halotolerans]
MKIPAIRALAPWLTASLTLLCSMQVLADKVPLAFVSQTIDTGFKLTHPLESLNLVGDANKELLAIGVDDRQTKWLAVYGLDGESSQYRLLHKMPLPGDLYRYDVSAKPKQANSLQSVYFMSRAHLSVLTVSDQGLALRELLDVAPLVVKPRIEFIARGEFVRDLNGDGRDDFIVGQFEQTQLFLSQGDGWQPQTLAIQPKVLLYRDGARYSETKLYFADMNFDGHDDIIKVGEGELEIYAQHQDGKFETYPRFQPVSQAISGLDWWDRRDAYGEALDQSDLVYRKVEALQDIDGDGLVDMVVRYTKSSGVLDRVNDYEIYLGVKGDKGVSFGKQPQSVIRGDGTLTGFELVDIDLDGRSEVLVSGFDIGLSQIIGALVSGSIDQDVHLFTMDDKRRFAAKPNMSKSVELSFSLTSGQSGAPVVKLADIDGDKRQDLLLSDGDTELDLFLGSAKGKPFDRKESLKLTLPIDGDMLSSEDLNLDGKADLLIKYGRQDKVELQSQFLVIMTQ